jgi:xanthine dehydrogenase YagR molybdenum-binding subunit
MKDELFLNTDPSTEGIDRVDGRAKVTGAAKYAAEHYLAGLTYGVIAGSSIAKGTIKTLDTKAAERAPGVLAVITYQNAIKIPGYQTGRNPAKPTTAGGPLRIFYDNQILFNGHPIALVVADTFERATYAASLIKATYNAEPHKTDMEHNMDHAATPKGPRFADYSRGDISALQTAPVKIEAEYILPIEVHNPMELGSITAAWDGEDKLNVFDKTQGVKSTQASLAQAFKIPVENVNVQAQFVGGGFGMGLRTWPYQIGAVMAAKMVKRPVKLMLNREQMFSQVGYRPRTVQQMKLGATADGKLVGISHEATAITSSYEEFTEGTVSMSRFIYACPNVVTKYKIVPLDLSTPTWMRGPGEATGAFALESAMDELAYALNMDPIELRVKNYAETDPERNKPFSSKYLKEAYQMGADKIGWNQRNPKPRSMQRNGWLVGYGMGSGTFNASRGRATVKAIYKANGMLILQTSVTDIGVGTGTAMTQIASEVTGIPASKIRFELGDSSFVTSPTQGGSTITSTVGSAVHDVCQDLLKKFKELGGNSGIVPGDYMPILAKHNLPEIEVTTQSQGGPDQQKYSMYSFSVHFCQVLVHPTTGVVRVNKVVSVADSGHIVSPKTARSQVIGGAIGGIGMALMEEGVIDHRFGRYVNADFANYHVPVNADIPQIDALFVNKADPYINPMGAKGMGEIALIGMAAAVANAVYHATGRRIRELPITPDKLMNS